MTSTNRDILLHSFSVHLFVRGSLEAGCRDDRGGDPAQAFPVMIAMAAWWTPPSSLPRARARPRLDRRDLHHIRPGAGFHASCPGAGRTGKVVVHCRVGARPRGGRRTAPSRDIDMSSEVGASMETSLEIVVRPTEVDVNGHVNNAKYVEYMEWGREEWYETTRPALRPAVLPRRRDGHCESEVKGGRKSMLDDPSPARTNVSPNLG